MFPNSISNVSKFHVYCFHNSLLLFQIPFFDDSRSIKLSITTKTVHEMHSIHFEVKAVWSCHNFP